MRDANTTPRERVIPICLIAIALILFALLPIIRPGAGGAGGALVALVFAVVQAAIFLVIGLGLASLLSVGLGDLRSAILKFAAICLVSSAVAALIPLGWIIAFVVFMGLTMLLFEVEVPYAAGFATVFTLIALVFIAIIAFASAPTLTR